MSWYEKWIAMRDRETITPERNIICCDIDGVLSNCTGRYETLYRGKNDPNWKPDWDTFHGPAMDTEPHHAEYVMLIRLLKRAGARIYLLTNRTVDLRARTARWCDLNHIPYDALFMRDFDMPFPEAKGWRLDLLIENGEKPSLGIDDDAAEEVAYRSRGIPFLYVHRGHHVGEL